MSACLTPKQVRGLDWLSGEMERNLKRVFKTDSTREVYQMLMAYYARQGDEPTQNPFYDIGISDVDSWLAYDSSDFYHDVNVFVYGAERQTTDWGTLAIGGTIGPRDNDGWRVNNVEGGFAQCLLNSNTNEKLAPLLELLSQPIAIDDKAIARRLRKDLGEAEWDDPILRLYITVYYYYNDASITLEIVKAFGGLDL